MSTMNLFRLWMFRNTLLPLRNVKWAFLYTDKMYKKEFAKHSFRIVDQNNTVFWDESFETEESDCNIIRV